MTKWTRIAMAAICGVAGGAVSTQAHTLTGRCTAPEARTHTDLTTSVQHGRYTVVGVDARTGLLTLRAESGTVYALRCHVRTPVTSAEGRRGDLGTLNAGDTVSISGPDGVTLLREAWQDLGTPEL